MRFIDFFAGIGGFRLGMEMAGHECVGHCEIDKFADKSYRSMHKVKENEWFANDIARVKPEDLPEAECYCFGFPCQSFSIAGERGGFEDTRGTLFFEVMRLVKERKPEILFAENVRGLLNHDKGRTFGTIIKTMDELGYSVEWQLYNSKYHVPQNRERVYIIGHFREGSPRKIFPIRGGDNKTAIVPGYQVLSNTIAAGDRQTNGTYPLSNGGVIKVNSYHKKTDKEIIQVGNIVDDTNRNFKNPQWGRIYSPEGISPCLSTMQGGKREPKIIDENGEEIRIRKLTPKECFRLQGFPDEYFERAAKVNSDSQLYKQIGNSVTVPVIYEIAKRLKEGEANV